MDDGFQNFRDAESRLCARYDGLIGRDCQNVLQLLFHRWDIGVRQVDLVDDRDDRQALLEGEVDVRHGLGLDALSGVHDEQAPSQAARLRDTS